MKVKRHVVADGRWTKDFKAAMGREFLYELRAAMSRGSSAITVTLESDEKEPAFLTDWPVVPELTVDIVDLADGRKKIVTPMISLGVLGDYQVPDIICPIDTTEQEIKETVDSLREAYDTLFLKIAASVLIRSGEGPYGALQSMIDICETAAKRNGASPPALKS